MYVTFILLFYDDFNHDYILIIDIGQREVATIFADQNKGLILELGHYDVGTEYFNCSFLSAFGAENERLFCGGFRPIQFVSIYELNNETSKNYRYFIRSLVLFDGAIKGYPLNTDVIDATKPTKTDYKIIKMLIRQYLNIKNNKFPKYINEIFEAFCKEKSQICIDIEYMNFYYPGFAQHFMQEKSTLKSISSDDIVNGKIIESNVMLLKYDSITSIFQNCKRIIFSNDTQSINVITQNHYDSFLLHANELKTNSMIEEIKIINPCESVSKLYSHYSGLFKKSGWILHRCNTEKMNSFETRIQIITRRTGKNDKSVGVFAKMAKIFGQK